MSALNLAQAGAAVPLRRFEGRVAIVTGAAWGMGRRHAQRLAAEGAKVALVDIREKEVKETAAAIPGAIGIGCDVSKTADTQRMAAEVQKAFGRIDILVNNAGGGIIPPGKKVWELNDEEWNVIVDVNLKGVWQCSRAVMPTMQAAKYGRIVNIASTAGLRPTPAMATYSAAKAGVINLTMSMASDLGPHGITVNAIGPGFIDSPNDPKITIPPHLREGLTQKHIQTQMVKRIGCEDDISNAVLFFALPDSEWITGQVLAVNGGDFCH